MQSNSDYLKGIFSVRYYCKTMSYNCIVWEFIFIFRREMLSRQTGLNSVNHEIHSVEPNLKSMKRKCKLSI